MEGASLDPSYLSARNRHLNLPTRRRDDLVELLGDALQKPQAVVLGEGVEEVLDGGGTGAAAGLLGQLGNDGRLVRLAQGRGRQNRGQLRVLLEERAEGREPLGRGVEGGGLDGGSVLEIDANC